MKSSLLSIAAFVVVLAASGAVTACSDDDHDHDDHDHDAHGSTPESCEAFHDACAAKSSSNPKAKECDDFVHVAGRTEADCAAKKDECVAACQ
ncbi:MAG: hypothetical protein KF837_35010 [Labilithrix sp.]|nr:hypothetical protein [Labilithrix sp.]